MTATRARRIAIELAALALAIGAVWWIARAGTSAWLARTAALGVEAPDAEAVHALAWRASLEMTLGLVVLAAGRAVGVVRARRDDAAAPWASPAVLSAVAVASLLGFAVQTATVEVAHGVAIAPTADGFAQGFVLGCTGAAIAMVAPLDLARVVARAQLAIAVAVAGVFAALAVLGSGPPGSGTRINLGPIQPIELVKPLAIALLAGYLGARAAKLRWHRRRVLGLRWPRLELLVPAIAVLLGIVAGLYVIGDLGPVLLLALVFLGMCYVVSRATGWALVALAVLAVVLVVLWCWPGLAGGGTVQTRLVMWRDPWTNGAPNGHQLADGLWAISAGGWDGRGLAHAVTPIVPAGKTDLALATLAEQLGARGLVAYHVAIAALVLGSLTVAMRGRTAERVLLASGIGLLALAQWLVILGGTLGYLPLTGIVVPFVSSGKTSMVVFVTLAGIVARLATDGGVRARSAELDELHAAARGVRGVAAGLSGLAIAASIAAAVGDRVETSARGVVARLADGTLVQRQNPRLVAVAARIRRGAILDRNGVALATSPAPGRRRYPLGSALGTLMGVSPSRVLLPAWALERAFDRVLRGYPERADAPRYRDFDPEAGPGALASPDLRGFVPLLDLDDGARDAAIAALDADLDARSVRLTLDARLQRAAATRARDAAATGHYRAVAAVVLDVDTGQVLARVQVPDYDPGAASWQAHVLAGDATFVRRFHGTYGLWPDKTGVQGMFQAGSVGKLFTAIAAVRAGHAGDRYPCRDADRQGPRFSRPGWPRPIHDFTGDRPHGEPDLVEAIAVSCNVYFGQLALALGPEPLIALRAAGLAVGYDDTLEPGAAGSRQLASTGFGQGAIAVNAVQAARLVAAIARGGRDVACPPTMRLDDGCVERVLVDDPARLRPVVAGMRRVMTGGTGARLVPPAGVRVYGKTGTADVRGFVGEEPFGIARGARAAPHSWFVAFAEPDTVRELAATARGRLAVAVVVPRGGTGAAAAGPLAMQILGAARELGYLAP